MRTSQTRTLIAGTTLVLGSVLLAACGQSKQGGPQAAGPQGPVEVGVATLQAQTVTLTTELSGRTSPYMVAEVRPQIGGIVQKRLFTEGGTVKAGQTLYQINPETYQAAYDSARASLARAEANATSARLKAERYKELIAINGVSRQEYDDADAANKQAQADVAAARAAVDSARINLSYTRIASPISGRIGKSSVTQGALLITNQANALATVQQLDPIYVDVTQSSAELLRLKRALGNGSLQNSGSAKVRLILEDGSEYEQSGTLQFADVTVDPSTGAQTLRAIFPNPKNELLPGMFVRARLAEGVKQNAILVPQQGVSRTPTGEATAMVVGPDGKVQPRPIKATRTVGDKWLVSEGLKAGEQVIVEGLQKIKPGAPVKPVPAKNLAAQPAPAAK